MRDWRHVLRTADAVCFDVDSTVSPDEGIDRLAEVAGQGEAVAAMTRAAMGGGMSVEQVFAQRFTVFKPSRQLVEETLRRFPPAATPGVAVFIGALRARGVSVHLVSGGFAPLVLPVAALVGVPADHVHCNDLHFDRDGAFAGYTAERATCRTRGKALLLEQLIAAHGWKRVVMIGDGATDLEARPPASLFIGYGGVVVRERVKAGADHFTTDFAELTAALTTG